MTAIEKTVIQCAAEAYNVDVEKVTLDTDIREELSNRSLMLLSFISSIEDALDVEVSMREAGQLKTVGDFAKRVAELAE